MHPASYADRKSSRGIPQAVPTQELCRKLEGPIQVAVRSSATAEDKGIENMNVAEDKLNQAT